MRSVSINDSYVFPASYGQQRLWFLCQLDPAASRAYHLCYAFRVKGRLDVGLLRRSLDALAERHESLRSNFVMLDSSEAVIGDQLCQVVARNGRIPVRETDIGEAFDDALLTAIATERNRPFDLETDALLRGCVMRRSALESVLVLTMHHIIADGWSSGILSKELSTIYTDLASGREVSLPSPPLQYADFAVWQREAWSDPASRPDLRFWTETLAALPPLEMPTDHARPPRQTYEGARLPVHIPAELASRLETLARGQDATMFMILLAVWQVVLARHAGQDDFGVGVPVAGRTRPELNSLVGFFVNTVVLRAPLSGRPSFTELLGRVRNNAIDAYAHQDTPFEKVVEELTQERDLGRHPLFQASFAYHNMPIMAFDLPDAEVVPIDVPTDTSAFELGLVLYPAGREIDGSLLYNRDLFDRSTAQRLADHWSVLLAAVVADPQLSVWELPMLDRAEERSICELSGCDRPFPESEPVIASFASWVDRTPDAPAVICAGQPISYAELDRRADRLADWLCEQGVGPDRVVGIRLSRSPQLLVALLAVLKAGGAYLPIDPALPAARAELMVHDADCELMLTDELLDADPAVVDRQHEARPRERAYPQHLAYVSYTSGSTGRPKGVMVTRQGLDALVHTMTRELGVQPGDVWTAVTTASFDIAALELLGPITSGACVALLNCEEVADAEVLARRLELDHSSVLQATPALWRMLASVDARLRPGTRVISTGEAMPADVAEWLSARAAATWNAYGPTETTIYSTIGQVATGQPITIGRPLPGEWAYVLDDALRPVPIGVRGELCIGGVGVTRGYLGRPGQTAQRFWPDPYVQGQRIYRTGDLVRRLSDGSIVFLGRNDYQIKLRGYRIELGEVESILTEHPDVAESIVTLRGEPGQERLVAYIVPVRPEEPPTADVLAEHMQRQLPKYMVPVVFVPLDELPLMPNGKVARGSLPDLPHIQRSGSADPPRTSLEKKITSIWCRLLGRDDIGIRDNFFCVGGNSMLAARFVAEVREELDMRLEIAQVFLLGTVEKISSVLDSTPVPDGPPSAELLDDLATLWHEESVDSHNGVSNVPGDR